MTSKENILSIVATINKDNTFKTMSIDLLLDAQMKLSILAVYLSEEIAEKRIGAKNAIFTRRSTVTRKYLSKKAKKVEDKMITDKLAEMESIGESDDVYLDELKKEAELESLEQFIRQTNVLIQSLTMRISNLKAERMSSTQNLMIQPGEQ